MPDLRQELRTYIDALAERTEQEAALRVSSVQERAQRGRWRYLTIGAAAVVMMSAVVATAVLIGKDADGPPGIGAGPGRTSGPEGDEIRGLPREWQGVELEKVIVFESGECFDAVSNPVDCSDLHTREDFASFEYQGSLMAPDSPPFALGVCELLFERYTGIALDSQDRYAIMLGSGGKPAGFIEIRCMITSPTGALQPTTGSARRTTG